MNPKNSLVVNSLVLDSNLTGHYLLQSLFSLDKYGSSSGLMLSGGSILCDVELEPPF